MVFIKGRKCHASGGFQGGCIYTAAASIHIELFTINSNIVAFSIFSSIKCLLFDEEILQSDYPSTHSTHSTTRWICSTVDLLDGGLKICYYWYTSISYIYNAIKKHTHFAETPAECDDTTYKFLILTSEGSCTLQTKEETCDAEGSCILQTKEETLDTEGCTVESTGRDS